MFPIAHHRSQHGTAACPPEVALHVARQTQVDAWIIAAYGRLHEAILDHEAALDALPRG